MLKKIIVPMMMVLLVSGQLLPVAASENDVEVPNIGVSEICPLVYHVFLGGGKTISYKLLFSLLVRQHSQIHSLALR